MAPPDEPAHPSSAGGDLEVVRERERIAIALQNEVVQRVFAVGLHLQSTAGIAVDPLVRRRVEQAIDDLDHVIRFIRDTVFGLHDHLNDRGLRAGILHLFEHLQPVPDISFRGPVDGALHPSASLELLDVLDHALAVLRCRWTPTRLDIAADDGTHITVLQAVPRPGPPGSAGPGDDFPGLRGRAAQAGIRIEIEPRHELVQITWHAA